MSAHDEALEEVAIGLWCSENTKRRMDWANASPDAQRRYRSLAHNLVFSYLTKRRETDGAVLTTTPRLYPEPSMHESAGVKQYACGYNEAVSIVQHRADQIMSEMENRD